jgi:predicted ribosome quality control (RQC) complex YloA/Tae2 family protein
VPIKEKERLQNEFRIAINKQLDKLKISKTEMQNINYRNRIEGIKDTPNSDRIMSNERVMLMNKKKKIEEEIKLWENNIGFLSKSKKAVQVREEFEKKIENAKQEVVTLNDKIKFLDKEMK